MTAAADPKNRTEDSSRIKKGEQFRAARRLKEEFFLDFF
jgi:hypothetical protein